MSWDQIEAKWAEMVARVQTKFQTKAPQRTAASSGNAAEAPKRDTGQGANA